MGEAGEDDIGGVDAARDFVGDQRFYVLLRFDDASCVFAFDRACAQFGAKNVVPGGHDVAAVQGHWHHRGVGEDEADGGATGQVQLGHDGGKVVATGTQAVHPDDGGGGVWGGFDFYAF